MVGSISSPGGTLLVVGGTSPQLAPTPPGATWTGYSDGSLVVTGIPIQGGSIIASLNVKLTSAPPPLSTVATYVGPFPPDPPVDANGNLDMDNTGFSGGFFEMATDPGVFVGGEEYNITINFFDASVQPSGEVSTVLTFNTPV